MHGLLGGVCAVLYVYVYVYVYVCLSFARLSVGHLLSIFACSHVHYFVFSVGGSIFIPLRDSGHSYINDWREDLLPDAGGIDICFVSWVLTFE